MGFKFLSLKYTQKDIEEAKNKIFPNYPNDYQAWDPSGISPDVMHLKEGNNTNYAKYNYIQKNPKYPKKAIFKTTTISSIIGIIIIILSIIIDFGNGILVGILVAIIPPTVIYSQFKSLGKDLVKLQIAQQNNWLYEPNQNRPLWQNYVNYFPEIFKKGHTKQHFEDIFWGAQQKNGTWNYFVTGLFRYTTVSRDSKGRRQETEHDSHFFAIRLPKTLKSRFFIYPENAFSKIGNFFSKKEINTESIKFNKTFAFSYNGEKNEKALNIVKALSPRVQEELLKLNEGKKSFFNGGISILFTSDTLIFYSSGLLISKLETDFVFKTNKVNEKDKEQITKELNTLIDISTEIVKYLD